VALEFALRPRIDLERPAPKRRRVRLPRFALLMAAYWVGAAGATVVLLRVMRDAPESSLAAERAEEPAPESAAELDDAVAANTQPPPVAEAAVASVASSEPPVAFTAEARTEPHVPEPPPRSPPPAPEPPAHVELRVPEPPLRVESPTPREPATAREPALSREPAAPRVREHPALPEPPPISLPSCETAAAAANETLDLRGAPAAPDLPREAFAAVLDNGAYLGACALPPHTTLEICAAVQDGRVVGVSASTEPRNPASNACVRRAVAALRFPKSPRLDVTRTRFDAAR